jgi:hypothetical protein
MRPCLEKSHHKKWTGGVAQGVGPEFNPWYHKKKNKKSSVLLSEYKLCAEHCVMQASNITKPR